jgi:small subunit ribosomal protein S16
MAVAIRMARGGSKKRPFYRIVATNSRSARDGRFIEQLGHYNPADKALTLDLERYDYWVGVGAQPSATMHRLAKNAKKNVPATAA